MAKKKIGIYGQLESTANNKVEDLYIIVDNQSIHFVVKHLVTKTFVAFESFVSGNDYNGFAQLLAYLQNNSKLMHAIYNSVHFVMNDKCVLISKKQNIKDHTIYQNELNMVFENHSDQELLVSDLNDNKVMIYSIPDIYQALLTRAFPTGKWSHYMNALVDYLKQDGVHLFFFDAYFIVYIVMNESLQFFSYFNETDEAQNIYNVLNACKHFQVNPNTSSLILTGYHSENNAWVVELGKYFKNAIIEHPADQKLLKSLEQDYPHHHFATYFIF